MLLLANATLFQVRPNFTLIVTPYLHMLYLGVTSVHGKENLMSIPHLPVGPSHPYFLICNITLFGIVVEKPIRVLVVFFGTEDELGTSLLSQYLDPLRRRPIR